MGRLVEVVRPNAGAAREGTAGELDRHRLTDLSGWVAYAVIGALVFGETAVFLGFVLPGETAVDLGGVLASRGHLSLARPPLRHRPTPRPFMIVETLHTY